MIKDWKIALGLGAGFWAIMFIGISAFMVMPLPEILQQICGIILAGVAGFILAKIYFKKNPGDIKAGIVLAISWLIVATILDLLITVQYVKAGGTYIDGLKGLYGAWNLWVGFFLMLVGVVVAAKMIHGGDLMKKPPVQQPPSAPTPPPTAPPAV